MKMLLLLLLLDYTQKIFAKVIVKITQFLLVQKKVLKDLLFKDSSKNKSFVVKRMRKGVKEASLEYSVLDTVSHNDEKISLVKIILHTGRTHQIRVQFSHRKMPLVGDGRYGGRERVPIALRSSHVALRHPFTKKKIDILCVPDITLPPWSAFDKKVEFNELFKSEK